MPGGHDTTIEVSNITSFVLYTQILKQSVLKPASPGITLIIIPNFIRVNIQANGPYIGGGNSTYSTLSDMSECCRFCCLDQYCVCFS